MSDTPETDAARIEHMGFYSCATVSADFARKLERERNEWRRVADLLAKHGAQMDVPDAFLTEEKGDRWMSALREWRKLSEQ